MFTRGFNIEDQLLSIFGTDFGVAERHRSAQIQKDQHGEVQSSMGGTEWRQISHSGSDKDRAAVISDRHHKAP